MLGWMLLPMALLLLLPGISAARSEPKSNGDSFAASLMASGGSGRAAPAPTLAPEGSAAPSRLVRVRYGEHRRRCRPDGG